jgi:hypothetical protein
VQIGRYVDGNRAGLNARHVARASSSTGHMYTVQKQHILMSLQTHFNYLLSTFVQNVYQQPEYVQFTHCDDFPVSPTITGYQPIITQHPASTVRPTETKPNIDSRQRQHKQSSTNTHWQRSTKPKSSNQGDDKYKQMFDGDA